MDVLELPRPVINFLRTMAKEGCRYVLSWDIFGGNDTVTLTLTWKANEEESKKSQDQVYDNLAIPKNRSPMSPDHLQPIQNSVTSPKFRSNRGKSLEENSLLGKRHQSSISTLKRASLINPGNNQLEPIYTNLYTTNSLQFPTTQTSTSLLVPQTNYQRLSVQQNKIPLHRKSAPTISINSNKISNLKKSTYHSTNDYINNEDISDPWVKRFEDSLENKTHEKSQDDLDEKEFTSGKVKFK